MILLRWDGREWRVSEPFARVRRGKPAIGTRKVAHHRTPEIALRDVWGRMTAQDTTNDARAPGGAVAPLKRGDSMQTELGFFAPRARRSDPRTSHEAAESMVEGAAAQRVRCLEALDCGPMTADEIDAHIGWRPTTAGRRLPELERVGAVRRLDVTRPTRSGRSAALWEVV